MLKTLDVCSQAPSIIKGAKAGEVMCSATSHYDCTNLAKILGRARAKIALHSESRNPRPSKPLTSWRTLQGLGQ